jgi:hypothetical protein
MARLTEFHRQHSSTERWNVCISGRHQSNSSHTRGGQRWTVYAIMHTNPECTKSPSINCTSERSPAARSLVHKMNSALAQLTLLTNIKRLIVYRIRYLGIHCWCNIRCAGVCMRMYSAKHCTANNRQVRLVLLLDCLVELLREDVCCRRLCHSCKKEFPKAK